MPTWLQLFWLMNLATRFPQVNEGSLFQQDGVTSHTVRVSVDVIWLLLHNHIISRNGDSSWPPRSPDLSACDFFMWALQLQSIHPSPTQYWSAETKNLWKNYQNSFGDAVQCYGKYAQKIRGMPAQRWRSLWGYHLQEINSMLYTLRWHICNSPNANSSFNY